MIQTRLLVSAFLFNHTDLLLMKRSLAARFMPGMWAPVGGHIEADEFRTPQLACEREILEETGLSAAELCDLSLRYIVHRIRQAEIRIQYCYFGTATKRELGTTDEGELYWIPLQDAGSLETSATTRLTLAHYLRVGSGTTAIYVGTMSGQQQDPAVIWAPLSDWE